MLQFSLNCVQRFNRKCLVGLFVLDQSCRQDRKKASSSTHCNRNVHSYIECIFLYPRLEDKLDIQVIVLDLPILFFLNLLSFFLRCFTVTICPFPSFIDSKKLVSQNSKTVGAEAENFRQKLALNFLFDLLDFIV